MTRLGNTNTAGSVFLSFQLQTVPCAGYSSPAAAILLRTAVELKVYGHLQESTKQLSWAFTSVTEWQPPSGWEKQEPHYTTGWGGIKRCIPHTNPEWVQVGQKGPVNRTCCTWRGASLRA